MDSFAKQIRLDLVEQFREQPNIESLADVVARQMEEVWDFYKQLQTERTVKTAVGKQLDGIGNIVDLTRADVGKFTGTPIPFDILDDETYRKFLIWKILKNTSYTTYPDIIKAFKMFWDYPLYYTEDPSQPATMIFDTGEMDGFVDTSPLFSTPLLRAAGVTLKIYARTRTPIEAPPVAVVGGMGYGLIVSEIPDLELDYRFRGWLGIGAGMDRITDDRLPVIERDYQFRGKAGVGTTMGRVTHDTLPTVDPDYLFRGGAGIGSVIESLTSDDLPTADPDYQFRGGAGIGSALGSNMTSDDLPVLERELDLDRKAHIGGAVHSVMETPIGEMTCQRNEHKKPKNRRKGKHELLWRDGHGKGQEPSHESDCRGNH